MIENLADEDIPIMVATRLQEMLNRNLMSIGYENQKPIRVAITRGESGYGNVKDILHEAKRSQALAIAQGDDYLKYLYII